MDSHRNWIKFRGAGQPDIQHNYYILDILVQSRSLTVKTSGEAVAVLNGILYHETELPLQESVVDTHGYTESLFGLFELEDKMLSP